MNWKTLVQNRKLLLRACDAYAGRIMGQPLIFSRQVVAARVLRCLKDDDMGDVDEFMSFLDDWSGDSSTAFAYNPMPYPENFLKELAPWWHARVYRAGIATSEVVLKTAPLEQGWLHWDTACTLEMALQHEMERALYQFDIQDFQAPGILKYNQETGEYQELVTYKLANIEKDKRVTHKYWFAFTPSFDIREDGN